MAKACTAHFWARCPMLGCTAKTATSLAGTEKEAGSIQTCRYCAAAACVTASWPLGLAWSVAMRASSGLGPMPALAAQVGEDATAGV